MSHVDTQTPAEVPADGVTEGAQTQTATESAQGDAGGTTPPALARSLMTDEDEEPGDEEGKAEGDAEGEKPASDAQAVPEKPEDYAITFAQGVSVDEPLLAGFKAEAHRLGIPQGQAQELADFYARHVGESAGKAQAAKAAALDAAVGAWEAEIKARPDYAKEARIVRPALKEFGGDALTDLINTSRIGSHPVFWDFMVTVGKALAEPETRGKGHGGGEKHVPLMDRLWPDT